ncbi:juvenile hormone acid O-methyltransferase [Rhipicephalus sanguineus]|uniref:juvenile hormone acid O-methyltransferase n=1 Tax=Rhipicephalus sanguineus TaxID=34632 RepID=UPI0018955E4A|nr:juvenile hormone acid O-methyltransferase [Rhipicephalus sanguineus]
MTTNISDNLRYNSKLYKDNNELQRGINLKAMDFLHMTFAPDDNTENQQFLDIGCGTGDFTRDWLLPRCSPCRRLVAVDASEDMLSYARTNSSHPKIQYDYLNIGDDVTDFLGKYGTFDRIYSFFCLNWLKDQAEAMRNLSRLLTPSGECLLLFPAWSPTRALWKEVAQLDRWKKFSNVFNEFTPKSQDLEDDKARLSYLRNILDSAGLAANTCELLYVKIDFSESIQAAVDINLSVNPVVASLSPEEEELFRKDVTNKVQKWIYADKNEIQRRLNLNTLNLLHLAFTPANTENQQFLDIGCDIQLSVNPVVASLSP